MRPLILAAGAALAVSACNRDEAANTTTNVDEDLVAQNISANDTTSIDAATGEDANMAAETVLPVNETGNDTGNDARSNAAGNAATNNAD
jgi:hypothetical protein